MAGNMIKLEDICKKYPFIYEIDGKYFYIGWGICKRCDSPIAIDRYKTYKRVLNEIGNGLIATRSRDIDQDSLDSLVFNYRKVIAYSEIATDYEEMHTFRGDIDKFIEILSGDNKNELLSQLNDFVNVYYYYNRNFI